MDFTPTEEQSAFQDTARQFAADHLAPHRAAWDRDSFFPRDTLRLAAGLGFGGLYCRDDVGGAGLGRLDAALVFEQLAAGCVTTTAFLTIHNMVAWIIDQFGDESLRHHYLPAMTRMDWLGAYCLTEPDAGSDAASLRCRAVRDGDNYVLDGSKAFISGAGAADIYVVMARTGGEGAGGISCFLVEKDTPGLTFGPPEHKMGWRAQPTAMVHFSGCRVPVARRLGAEGEGFKIAMKALDGGRINIAACSLGGAMAALDKTIDYAQSRRQFGKNLNDFQATQFKLADMKTGLEASRLLVYRAAASLDAASPDATTHSAMAKRFATDTCFQIVDHALQIHGGYGYLQDYGIEQIFRDLRVHSILEGTNEVMRLIIARSMRQA